MPQDDFSPINTARMAESSDDFQPLSSGDDFTPIQDDFKASKQPAPKPTKAFEIDYSSVSPTKPEASDLDQDDFNPKQPSLIDKGLKLSKAFGLELGSGIMGMGEMVLRAPEAAGRALNVIQKKTGTEFIQDPWDPDTGIITKGIKIGNFEIPGSSNIADDINIANKIFRAKHEVFQEDQELLAKADEGIKEITDYVQSRGQTKPPSRLLNAVFNPGYLLAGEATDIGVAIQQAVKMGKGKQLAEVARNPQAWAAASAQAIPSLATAYASGGSLAVMGFLEAMSFANDATEFEKETGIKMSDEEFTIGMLQTGIINGLLEKAGLDSILKPVAAGTSKLLKPIMQAAVGGGGEATTEVLQQLNSNLAKRLTFDEKQNLLEGVGASFLGGFSTGGVAGGVSAIAQRLQDRFPAPSEQPKIDLKLSEEARKHNQLADYEVSLLSSIAKGDAQATPGQLKHLFTTYPQEARAAGFDEDTIGAVLEDDAITQDKVQEEAGTIKEFFESEQAAAKESAQAQQAIEPEQKPAVDQAQREVGQISWESRPGRSTGVLPEVNDAPIEQQQEFHGEISKALRDESGVDIIADALGIRKSEEFKGPGVWEGQVSPGSQTMLELPGADPGQDLTQELTDKYDAYARILGLTLYQEGVGWHIPKFTTTREEASGTEIDIGRTVLENEAKALYTRLEELAKESGLSMADLPIIPSEKGVRVLNFTGQDNVKIQDLIEQAAQEALPDGEGKVAYFKSTGNLVTNNWKENQNGEDYQQNLTDKGFGPALAEARRILSPRIQAVHQSFAQKYGWSNPAGTEQLQGRSGSQRPGTRGSDKQVPQGQPQSLANLQAKYDSFLDQSDLRTPQAKEYAKIVRENLPEFIRIYKEEVLKEYGISYPNVISGDLGKTIKAPFWSDFRSEDSIDRHGAASAAVKIIEDELLKDPSRKDMPVLVLAGISGAGKTTSLKGAAKGLDAYAMVRDTNLSSFNGAKKLVEKILASGHQVEVSYTDRNPIVAFIEGVYRRFKSHPEARVISKRVHLENMRSKEVFRKLVIEYSDNPKFTAQVFDNTRGRGEGRFIAPEEMKDWKETPEQVGQAIEEFIKSRPPSEITEGQRQTFLEGGDLFQEPGQTARQASTFEEESKKANLLLQRHGIERTIQLAKEIITPSGKPAAGVYRIKSRMIEIIASPRNTTGFHEAFHVIEEEVLKIGQHSKRDLYEEVKKQTGSKTDIEAREKLADAFAEYANKREAGSWSDRMIAFFEDVLNYIRGLFGKSNPQQDLFNQILYPKNPYTVKITSSGDALYQEMSDREAAVYKIAQGQKPTPEEFAKFPDLVQIYEEARPIFAQMKLAKYTGSVMSDVLQSRIKELAKKLGYQPSGIAAKNEIGNPDYQKNEEDKKKLRGFIETVKESKKTPPKISDVVAETQKAYYAIAPNAQTVLEADRLIKENPNKAMMVAKNGKIDRTNFAVALRLIHAFNAAGQYEQAIDIIESLSSRGTQAGQAIQILSLYNRLTPDGIIFYAQRLATKANRKLQEKGLEPKYGLKPDLMIELKADATKIQGMPEGRKKMVETAKMMKKAQSVVPPSMLAKISTFQTIMQLLNMKTMLRNIIGNAGFWALENISDSVGATLDLIVGTVATKQRTQFMPKYGAQLKGLQTGFIEGVQDAVAGIDTSEIQNKYALQPTSVFTDPILGSLEKALSISLRAPDRAFYHAAFNQELHNQMRIKNVSVPTPDMIDIARFEGLRRTFQDDNTLSRIFTGLKKSLNANQEFGFGDMVIKYPKTPANILMRGIEYSPANFVNTVTTLAAPMFGQKFDQRKFVHSTSRALVGSSLLVGTGFILAALGIMRGRAEKDKDVEALLRTTGIGNYTINASALARFVASGLNPEFAERQENDQIISYDWFQPQAIGLAMGANIFHNPEGHQALEDISDIVSSALTTLVDQPLMQGIKGMTQGYDSQSVVDSAFKTLEGVPASFVPTLLNQIRQLKDNTARNTSGVNFFDRAYKRAAYRVPFGSETLEPRVTVWGEDQQVYQDGTNTPFNVFMNPAFMNRYKPSPEARMVLDVWQSTGIKTHFPRVADKKQTVNGEKIELDNQTYVQFQRYIGEKTGVLYSVLAENDKFMGLPDEARAKILSDALTDISTSAKILLLGHRPKNVTKSTLKLVAGGLNVGTDTE